MGISKVIIVTGASKGIGLAVAQTLASDAQDSRVVAVARTHAPLENLKRQHSGRVEVLVGDLGADMTVGQKAVSLAMEKFGRLDGVVVNHGTLTGTARLREAKVEEWKEGFDINVFSTVALIKACLPHLRSTKGTVLFTSSGAAVKPTSTWGCYGASKAVLNHLAMTLSVEEPDIATIAVRPGVVDTDMQLEIRDKHFEDMDEKDVARFRGLRERGEMLKPEQPGAFMARLVLSPPRDLSGKMVNWDDPDLKAFREGF